MSYDDPTVRQTIQNILGGLAIFLAVVIIFGGMIFSGAYAASHNNQKVQTMTTYCVSHGYSGWSDSGDHGTIGCIGGRPND